MSAAARSKLEQQRRSIAMMPAGQMVMTREQALELHARLQRSEARLVAVKASLHELLEQLEND